MLEVQSSAEKNFLPVEKILSEVKNNEPITFEPGELKYFIAEIKEMIDKNEIIDLPKAIHNAKYFSEIAERKADIQAKKNIVSFSDEELEKFTDAQDIS